MVNTGATFDLKNAPAKFMMQSCKFSPPQWRRQWRQMRQQSPQGYRRDNDNNNDGRRQRRRQRPMAAAAAAAADAASAAQRQEVGSIDVQDACGASIGCVSGKQMQQRS
jgi:hypothetical protein